ncbi:MAG: UDP-glucose 4-epimerase GalE [Deltaproteobacteria bacterium]|nr:UDP-glucose 4-epimerase GalE [Deltaproteobacteria bacterium]
MNVLVTGGAGYIGSHAISMLADRGHNTVCIDNLVKGHKELVRDCTLYEDNISDKALVKKIFNQHKIDAVMHFAAYSLVGESVKEPLIYYRNNVSNTLSLIEAMLESGVDKFIYSSSAGVYGEPDEIPITEGAKLSPTNPYGKTKIMVEEILKDFDRAYNLKFVSLRYFNAAGAHPDATIGEDHNPETHLIPLVLDVALGRRNAITIYGDDWPTRDRTCIRDYIHVCDLIDAHILALSHLAEGGASDIFNLGNGRGYTVKDVIDSVSSVTGCPIPTKIGPRRPGDPAVLVASSEKITKKLGWNPRFKSLEDIIETAWSWHKRRFG